jgi:hypothetical protein
MTWVEFLDQLEEWVRRADDPAALPPVSAPSCAPVGDDAVRARTVLALMATRQDELQTERRQLFQAASYARA